MMFRLATRGEASRLAQIEHLQPLSAGWEESGFKTELDNRYAQIWVCTQGEKIIGNIREKFIIPSQKCLKNLV